MRRLFERVFIALILFGCQSTFAEINRNVQNGCWANKGCFFKPTGCKPFDNCEYFMSYSASANNTVTFELMARINGEQNQWIAMGLSNDEQMGDDAVTYCIYSTGNQQPIVGLAYNPSKTFPEKLTQPGIVTPIEGGKIDNSFLCRFTRTVNPQPFNNKIRSLNDEHYIILASGIADQGNNFQPHVMDRNSPKWPFISGERVALADTSKYSTIVSASARCVDDVTAGNLIKAHGILMLFGWWVFIANGILFARYFKSSWPTKKPCGIAIWFHVHRGFNLLGVLMIASAFICIFIATCGEWIGDDWPKHAITGMTACICAFVQPFIAALRCPPNTSKRPIFDWIHRFIGLGGFACACATIYFARYFKAGLENDDDDINDNENHSYGAAPLAMMIFYWAALVCVVLILELAICFAERLERRKVIDEMHMQGLKGEPSTEGTGFISKPVWNALRLSLWVLFFIIAIAVAITLSCFIGLKEYN